MNNLSPVVGQAKITTAHLERQAVVYIRQSSLKQVREHPGSQINQRALVERAQALGWHQERILVFDADLGQSATQVEGRNDFKALAAEVALGHVGILFGWEVSRLARNNADWYHLLDVAALFGTLIADVEGIYDPRVYNDRLLLGLKGTMSEAELHLMRQRLTAGRLSKVTRGEYVQHLPTGLIRLPDNRVVKDPDDQVRHVIELVFARFAELGSCQKVLRFLKEHSILLPRRQTAGFHKGELLWKKPSAAAIYEILGNPAYAGTFVYGRRPKDPTRQIPGRRATGFVRKPVAEWQHIQHDIYPAYLSWEQYVANQATMRENALRRATRTERGRGTPREGAALLQGLATCGECGHVMKTAYKRGVRYLCDGLRKEFAEPMCASLSGGSIDAAVVRAFMDALQPAQLDALEALLAQRRQERAQVERYWEQQIQRATYEVHLARRRYEAVDPANRLVAAELERRWEEALIALRQTQETAERCRQEPPVASLDPHLRHQLEHIAQALPELWNSDRLTNEQKKRLLRSLIVRVILKRTVPDCVEVKIVWVSGHFSVYQVQPPIWRECDVSGYARMVERVQELWREGLTDTEIAAQLTREGFHSARSATVVAAAVRKIRLGHQWYQPRHQIRGADELEGYLTAAGLAKRIGVDRKWVYGQLAEGKIEERYYTRHPQSGTYRIADDREFLERLRRQAPGKREAGDGANLVQETDPKTSKRT
jgi:DNA invertase Pin-like site-specific DNA recombinase